MVTAWSPSRVLRRVRGHAGAARLLSLAVLVFSLVIAHGVSCGNTDGRTADGAPDPAAVSAPGVAAHEHGHGHGTGIGPGLGAGLGPGLGPGLGQGQGHGDAPGDERESGSGHDDPQTGGECVSGQPQQGPVLSAPCLVPFAQDAEDARDADEAGPSHGAAPAVTPLAASRRSVVQRI